MDETLRMIEVEAAIQALRKEFPDKDIKLDDEDTISVGGYGYSFALEGDTVKIFAVPEVKITVVAESPFLPDVNVDDPIVQNVQSSVSGNIPDSLTDCMYDVLDEGEINCYSLKYK